MSEILRTLYYLFNDADSRLTWYALSTALSNDDMNTLMDIHSKIYEIIKRLHDCLRDYYEENEIQNILEQEDKIKLGVWKDVVNTDIRPDDNELVLVINEYEDSPISDLAYYNKSADIFEHFESFDCDYYIFNSKNSDKFKNRGFSAAMTHYMSLPKPPKRKDRLPLNNEEEDDE